MPQGPFIPKRKKGPEAEIQDAFIHYLRAREWMVEETHGNLYSNGFPDLYCAHYRYKTRWIDIKVPGRYSFTPAQMKKWPEFAAKGVGIWIITAATEYEYLKLWQPPNWAYFLDVWKTRMPRSY